MRETLSQHAFRLTLRPLPRGGLERLGNTSCGWVVPAERIDPSSTCYTAGVGEDATFDVALAELGCDVVAIDPTPRAIHHITPFLERHDNLRLAPYAVWTEDTELEFFPPADRTHVSHSILNRQQTSAPLTVPARTLDSIAAEFDHDKIDLLKLDIEGAEYAVLHHADLRSLGVQVLCVEYHRDHGLRAMIESVRALSRRGYDVVSVRRTDVTLVCRDRR